jgi:hypothetical protein
MPPKNVLVIFGIFYHDEAKVINYVSLLFAFIFLLPEKFTLPPVFFWRVGHKKNRPAAFVLSRRLSLFYSIAHGIIPFYPLLSLFIPFYPLLSPYTEMPVK